MPSEHSTRESACEVQVVKILILPDEKCEMKAMCRRVPSRSKTGTKLDQTLYTRNR